MAKIVIHEVGLRDGLQMEEKTVPTSKKLQWVKELIESGFKIIQVGSFVHPKYVPQMADTDELFKQIYNQIKLPDDVTLSALVLNEKGVERGFNCNVQMFCMGVSASETHSKKNTNMSVDEALERINAMGENVLNEGKNVQVSVQSAFGCGYDGKVAVKQVLRIVDAYLKKGFKKISLADTAGHATPRDVENMFTAIHKMDANAELTCHFHNTYGMGLANCYAAYQSGVSYFEAAFGGLGGCPFTKIAGGNVCTEDLVHMFQKMGLVQEINLPQIVNIARDSEQVLHHELPGMIYKVMEAV